jgi:hypothetical protein
MFQKGFILFNYFFESMVELYCSWCKDLPESKKALAILKDSNEFSGIELSNTDNQVDLVLDSGLKVSIHNPARFHKVSVESQNFIEVLNENPSILKSCKKASLPFVSFHAGQQIYFSKFISKDYLLSNTRKNLRFLDHELDKKIILEQLWLKYEYTQLFGLEKECALYSTSMDYLQNILESTNAGILLDVAHTLSSASSRIRSKQYQFDEKNYFMDVLNAVSKNIFQMHINCPQYTKTEGFVDKHFPFESRGVVSKTVFDCTSEAIAVSPNLKAITLEIEPGLEPIKHAKLMIKQAKLVRKKLNF